MEKSKYLYTRAHKRKKQVRSFDHKCVSLRLRNMTPSHGLVIVNLTLPRLASRVAYVSRHASGTLRRKSRFSQESMFIVKSAINTEIV